MKHFSVKKTEQGFALLLAVIISSVVLAIGISILHISINQLSLSSEARDSELAFQAAHAGIDCAEYWRNENADAYTATADSISNPSINCFAPTNSTLSSSQVISRDGAGNAVNVFKNTIGWGDPLRCTSMATYVMVASPSGSGFSWTFENQAIGTNGVKTCNAGNTCTVIISDGYNHGCSDITSPYSVQRELTVEY